MDRTEWHRLVWELGQPFTEHGFLPKAQSGGKALALPFINSRDVQSRLDQVAGADWSFDFVPLNAEGTQVQGRLTIHGVTRCDAGEANKEEEPLKSAVSDALKRCAVQFGIGRYVYELPQGWFGYDGQKRRWIDPPQISQAAIDRAVELAVGFARPEGSPRPAAPRQEPPRAPAAPPVNARARQAVESAERKSIWAAAAPAESGGDARVAGAPELEMQAPAGEPLVCSTERCGTSLTKNEETFSKQKYGKPLCRSCQQAARGQATGNAYGQGA